MKSLIACLLYYALLYFCIAFIALEIDFTKWDMFARFLYIMFTLTSIPIAIVVEISKDVKK